MIDIQHDRIARRQCPLLDRDLMAQDTTAREALHVRNVSQILGPSPVPRIVPVSPTCPPASP